MKFEIVSSFEVNFDYEQSFADMVKAGNYYYVRPDITSENFALDAECAWAQEIFILRFGVMTPSEPIIKAMDAQGLRPATLTHALALGANYPEAQKQGPIIFLGSPWVNASGDDYVPRLDSNVENSNRVLNLVWSGGRWRLWHRFAAVRK